MRMTRRDSSSSTGADAQTPIYSNDGSLAIDR